MEDGQANTDPKGDHTVHNAQGNVLVLAGYTWTQYCILAQPEKAPAEAAALEAAFKASTVESRKTHITQDLCSRLLSNNAEFRALFLHCWEMNALGDLYKNATFLSALDVSPSSFPGPDSSASQTQSHVSPSDSSQTVPNSKPESTSTRKPVLGNSHHDNFGDVEAYWPRRLLHIPTMTSIERTGLDTYGHVQQPEYGILTYTWGRWKRRENDDPGPSLGVKGTPWEIPSVKEEHFTVESFHKVVQKMGEEVEWAWIDIACIEQRDGNIETKAVKMDEIGRQVGIFKNAHRVFVWLSHLETETLTKDLDNLWQYGPELKMLTEYSGLEGILSTLERSLSAILADPWFSSLWTLQEMILRKDALIFTREANTIPLSYLPEQDVSLPILVNTCANIHEDLMVFREKQANMWTEISNLFFTNPNLDKLTSKILEDINKAGFSFLITSNPNVQYGVAQYRHTRRPLDRIYGIMQIYNLRVGEAINPQKQPTLDELEDEFAAAICARCPILGQRFVHLNRPQQGKAWRISQFSYVPSQILVYKDPSQRCTIRLNTLPNGERHAIFKGQKCSLFSLSTLWVKFISDGLPNRTLPRAYLDNASAHLEIILDKHCIKDLKSCTPSGPEVPPTRMAMRAVARPAQHVAELCHRYGNDMVDVLELGTVKTAYEYRRENTQEFVAAPERFGIVTRQILVEEGAVSYERLGLCVWNNLAAFGETGEEFDKKLSWEEIEARLV